MYGTLSARRREKKCTLQAKHSRNPEELLESIELEPYAGLIQSRFGELRVGEARYEDLLGEVDEAYLSCFKALGKALGGAGA